MEDFLQENYKRLILGCEYSQIERDLVYKKLTDDINHNLLPILTVMVLTAGMPVPGDGNSPQLLQKFEVLEGVKPNIRLISEKLW